MLVNPVVAIRRRVNFLLLEEGMLGRGAPEGGPEGPVALPPQKERRRIYPQIWYDMI